MTTLLVFWRYLSTGAMCWRWGFWLRLFGYGVLVRRFSQMGLLYSERDGRWPGLIVAGGWVIKPLRRKDLRGALP